MLCNLFSLYRLPIFEHRVTRAVTLASPSGDLPIAAQAAISGALGRDDEAYAVVPTPNGYRAGNPAHGITAEFTASGVRISHGDEEWALELLSYGYGDAASAIASVEPRASANRVEYARDVLTEWYVNGPLGLEQGITFERPPEGERQATLTLKLSIAGNLHARVTDDGAAIALERVDGATVLRYAGLVAQDANGQPLHAWMAVLHGVQENQDEALLLYVDDHGAMYPLTVDPFVQTAELSSSNSPVVYNDYFGYSVAISGDGNTIVVGAPYYSANGHTSQGESYVFVKPSAGWTGNLHEQARLTSWFGAQGDKFGWSVGISGDGNIIVVGAPYHTVSGHTAQGAAYVFVKPSGGWSGDLIQDAVLDSSDGVANDYFGWSVGINGGGDTIVVGAVLHAVGSNANQGQAYVFVKPCPIPPICFWTSTNEVAGLTSSDGATSDNFGDSVSISGDGSTIVVGAPWHDIVSKVDQGEAYVYDRPGGGWSGNPTEDATLTSKYGNKSDLFGFSVAIDSAGSTIVVGAPYSDVSSFHGSAHVFLKSSGGWSGNLQEQALLIASNGAAGDFFGTSVGITSINGSGGRIIVGAPYHTIVDSQPEQGEVYVFAACPPASSWCVPWFNPTEIAKLSSSDAAWPWKDHFGKSVAIDGAGNTIVVGAPSHNGNTYYGAAYVFPNLFINYLPFIRK